MSITRCLEYNALIKPERRITSRMTGLEFTTQLLAITGVGTEGVCALLFVSAGKVRKLPLVFAFLAYLTVSDASLIVIARREDVWPALMLTTYIGYFIEAAAVWEVAWKLIDTSGKYFGRYRLRALTFCCGMLLIGSYLMTNMMSYKGFGAAEQTFLHIDMWISIYRVLVFIAMFAFLRIDSSRQNGLTTRIAIMFAAYASFALLRHGFDELAPKLKIPVESFVIADCTCGFIWILLLFGICWYLFRSEVCRIVEADYR
jgi:hypothetical protein